MITASGWKIWRDGVVSVRRPWRCSKAAGATLDWNGVLHSRGIQWRVAWCSFFFHRFVHRSAPDRGPAALKFTQRPPQPSTDFRWSGYDGLSIRSKIDATWKQWDQSACLSARGWLPRQKHPVGRNTALTLWIGMEHNSFNRVCAFASRALCAPPGSF